MQFRFRLIAENDQGRSNTFYCDSVATTLRVWDNTRARRGGVKFTSVEYARMVHGKCGRWYPVDIEDLRQHDIQHIYEVDTRHENLRFMIFVAATFFAASLAALWYFR